MVSQLQCTCCRNSQVHLCTPAECHLHTTSPRRYRRVPTKAVYSRCRFSFLLLLRPSSWLLLLNTISFYFVILAAAFPSFILSPLLFSLFLVPPYYLLLPHPSLFIFLLLPLLLHFFSFYSFAFFFCFISSFCSFLLLFHPLSSCLFLPHSYSPVLRFHLPLPFFPSSFLSRYFFTIISIAHTDF